LLKNGQESNEYLNEFVEKAKEDKNEILVSEASEI
jgi:glutaminyl-tRNA synthetase